MVKRLERMGDRLLGRMVPRVTAGATSRGCWGIFCGCIANFAAYRVCNNCSCGKCPSDAC